MLCSVLLLLLLQGTCIGLYWPSWAKRSGSGTGQGRRKVKKLRGVRSDEEQLVIKAFTAQKCKNHLYSFLSINLISDGPAWILSKDRGTEDRRSMMTYS